MNKTLGYVLISTLMFSSMEIALKFAEGAFSPLQLNFLRFLIGGLVLLPLAIKRFQKFHYTIQAKDIGVFLLTGFTCVIVSMTLYQLAIDYDEASTVAVVFSCNPVFSILFAYLLLHEPIGRLNLITMIISLVGLLVIVNPMKLTNPVGLSLAIGAAITFGLYSIISRWSSLVSGFDGLSMTCFTFIAGSMELMTLILISKIPVVAHWMRQVNFLRDFANTPMFQNVNLHYFWLLFFISVCVTGGGFAFYFLAMDSGGVSMASLVFFIKPGLAPILAALILGEDIKLNTIIGIVIILISSVITFTGNQTKTKSSKMLHEDDAA